MYMFVWLEAVQTSDSCAGKIAILSIQPLSNIICEAMTWRVCVDLILSGLSYRFANAQNIYIYVVVCYSDT